MDRGKNRSEPRRSMSVNRIPPEIWAQVFLHYMKNLEGKMVQPFHPDRFPLILTSVCRKWRDTALTTPHLWTDLWLPPPPREWDLIKPYISAVRGWLKCSQSLPISIQVRDVKKMPGTFFRSYLSALLAHSSRWETFTIGLEGQIPSLAVFDTADERSFPILRSFSISEGSGPIPQNLVRALGSAPRLTSLDLGHSIMDNSWAHLPFSQLTDLSLSIWVHGVVGTQTRRLDMGFFVSSMKACSKLRSLTLSFSVGFLATAEDLDDMDTTVITTNEWATIVTLEDLHLQMDPDVIALFSSTLRLPNLKTLLLFTEGEPWSQRNWDVFCSFCTRFSSSLTRLEVHEAQFVTDQLIDFLCCFPELQRLDVSSMSRLSQWDQVFTFLGSPWCPNKKLKELTLDRSEFYAEDEYFREGEEYDWGYPELVDMLNYRRTFARRDGLAYGTDVGTGDAAGSRWEQISYMWMLHEDITRMEKEYPASHDALMKLVDEGLRLKMSKVQTEEDDEEDEDGSVSDIILH